MTTWDSSTALMQRIFDTCGGNIRTACLGSSVSESFLAALVANESGGNLSAKRFESAVLVSLWQVLLGRTANFGSIGRADLVRYVAGNDGTTMPANLPVDAFQRVDALATSWGYTQILGYNAMAAGKPISYLQDAAGCLDFSIAMLKSFATRFDLDVSKDFEQLFDCWNSGRPGGKTYDPMYTSNGLARMQLYQRLLTSPAGNGEEQTT